MIMARRVIGSQRRAFTSCERGSFLNRAGRASIYNTSVQTFYYDAQPPVGQVIYPNENDTLEGLDLRGSGYVLIASVTEVWYKILDGDPTNDDSATTASNGNGVWVQATQLTANPAVSSQYTRTSGGSTT